MAKSVYVPEAGGIIDFPDEATPKDIVAYVDRVYGGVGAVAPTPAAGPDDSTLLGRAAYGFATGFTEIPAGVASLFVPAEKVGETSAGQFSAEARKYLQDTFGIDPTKDPTAAQQAMEALGSVGSFLVPGAGAAKAASMLGRGAKIAGGVAAAEDLVAAQRAAKIAGTTTAAAQGAALGAAQRTQKIEQQLASGMEISPEDQLASQRLDAIIGLSEAMPIERFFGPITTLLSKVPASKAPVVEQILKSRLANITKAGLAEGAQEAASNIANDIVEYGVYNPDVEIGQDILSNAGTGAFAGSFVEGVIQLAAGRKLRPYRQLQQDIAAEKQQNLADLKRGTVADAAERLRQLNVEGPVEVTQEEIDNEPVVSIKTKGGNIVGSLPDIETANQAIDLYRKKTGAKVSIVEPVKAPDVFPVKIAGESFGSMDDILSARDALRSQFTATNEFLADAPAVERNAKLRGVAPAFYRKKVEGEAASIAKKLEKFDEFARVAAPAPTVPQPAADIGGGVMRGIATRGLVGLPPVEISPGPAIWANRDSDLPVTVVDEPAKIDPSSGAAFRKVRLDDGTENFVPEAEIVSPPVRRAAEAVSTPEVEQPVGAIEAAPEAPAEGIAAIPEAEVAPTSFEEPLASKTEPIPVPLEPETKMAGGPLPTEQPRRITPKEAIASVTAPREYTPEEKAYNDELYSKLKARLDSIATPGVKLELQEMIDTVPGYLIRGHVKTNGTPNGVATIVELSKGILRPDDTIDNNVNALLDVLNHEIIHVVRNQLRPVEWRALSRAVETTKVPGKKYTYLDKAESVYTPNGIPITEEYADPEAVIEEAVAEMYRDWVRNGTAPPQTRGPFNRITEFFRRIFRVLKSSAQEDVFKRIEAGEVGRREVAAEAQPVTTETKFSAAPVDPEEFRRWFGNSKAVNPDGTPQRWLHGTPYAFDKFGRGRSGSLKGQKGPFYFTRSPKFADGYSMTKSHKGGYGAPVKSGSRTIPVYLSVQKPFDYENPQDLYALGESMAIDRGLRDEDVKKFAENAMDFWKDGDWEQMERPDVQKAIRSLGYDGFYLNENGFKNLAVYSPVQVKSILNPFEPGTATSEKFSAAPLPTYIETKNDTLFAKHDKVPFFRMMFDFVFKPDVGAKVIDTEYGRVEIGKWTQAGLAGRAALVDKNAAVTYLEKILNEKTTGNFERMTADYSATAALAWRNRSSHLTAAMIRMGKLEVNFARPGDIQSATMKVSEDADSLMNVIKVLMEPGPTDSRTNEQKDKREVFKSYAVAMRAKNKKDMGLSVPGEVDDNYIRTVIPFTEQNYPEVVEAYKMYQRFNKKLLESAVNAGLIKRTELDNLTRQMDYYGFYHEVYDTAMVPGMATKTASQFKLRPYKGSEFGNLVNDPVFVMIQNAQFWVDSIAKNLATTKSFKIAEAMKEARLLGTGEDPKEDQGEMKQVMFYKDNGVQKRFAVKDPLLVTALGSSDSIDMGNFFRMMGLPTQWIRESVTRDPGFMVANLLRDTLSSWITSGEDVTPFIDTAKGFKSALKKESSFQALMGRGVVGSYDLAMLAPAELANKIGKIATPKNVHLVPNLENGIGAATALWDRLGALSEASDAATRIAVYESALNQGMSEAEAAFRAIEIMDFSRRGGSALMGVLTKLIPFLNARVQGLDVLWQAGKAGYRFARGTSLGERDANLGKKFLVRGGMLAALSMVLEMWNSDDEDYQQLDEYIKTGNLLIPLEWLGMKGEFLAIPKPFEAGLLFSTFPQQFYKSMSGDASTRENLNLFTTQFAATFGVNFVPQVALPAVEAWWNIDFYTGLPLISEGKARLAPELQYNSSTSTLSMMLGKIPVKYNLTTGKFEGVSPIIIENLIEGYSGPIGSMIVDAAGIAMDGFDVGPERMPTDMTKLPVVRRVFIDAEKKNPKVVTQAYELFQIMDETNRTFSRLRQIGDVEAIKDYVEENRTELAYKKYVFKMVDGLNKLNARERQIERDETMTADEKKEAMLKLRELRINIASKVAEINEKLGR